MKWPNKLGKYTCKHPDVEWWFDHTKISICDFKKLIDRGHWSHIEPYIHRIDGPAFCDHNYEEYYLDGQNYSYKIWLEKTPLSNEEKVAIKLSRSEEDDLSK